MTDQPKVLRLDAADGAAVVAVYRRINEAIGTPDHGSSDAAREFLTQSLALVTISTSERRDAVLALAAWSDDDEWTRIARALSSLSAICADVRQVIADASGLRSKPDWCSKARSQVLASVGRSGGVS